MVPSRISKSSSLCTVVLLTLLAGCATKNPHVGESITQTQVADGVTVTESDSRRLLPNGKIAGEDTAHLKVEAVVDMIDYRTREMVLSTPQGESVALTAGPEIRNFNQIRVGDKVTTEYLLAVAFEVRKPTEQELAASKNSFSFAARSKMGDMPAAGAVRGAVRVATVDSINTNSQTISVSGLNPDTTTQIKAKYPENLAFVKAGDSIVVTAVEGFATSVNRIR